MAFHQQVCAEVVVVRVSPGTNDRSSLSYRENTDHQRDEARQGNQAPKGCYPFGQCVHPAKLTVQTGRFVAIM